MEKFGIFCLAICLVLSRCLSQTLDTYPVQNEGEDKIIVEVADGDIDTDIYCAIVDNGNVVTQWSVNNTNVEFDPSTFVGLSPFSYLSVKDDPSTNANLTVNFTGASFPLRQEITCHNINNSEAIVFLIGSITAPKLIPTASVYNITEGSNLNLDLQYIIPFPPYNDPLISTWLLNGTVIDDARIVTGDYNISIPSVWRELTGLQFKLTVSTSLGNDSQSFELNVQYPPEAEYRYPNVTEYGEVGGEVTLIAVDKLIGNPVPMYTWTGPGGATIVFDNNKYIFPSAGRLLINNIENNDFGTYHFDASNGIGTPLTIDQELLEAERPGQPRSVTAVNVEDESATIQWMEPLLVGAPPLNGYSIELLMDSNVMQTVTVSSLTTMSELTDLIPATDYNVTVTSTSTFQFMSGEPESSDPITFTTDKGVPRVDPDQTTIAETNSNIVVSYKLVHTGGFDAQNVTIEVTCGRVNSFTLPTESKVTNGDTIPDVEGMYSNDCIENCLDNSLSGQLTVDGELTAGNRYVCVVIAGNDIGDFYYNTSAVTAQTGIPSSPVISVQVNIGSITVTLQSLYPGVQSGDDSFFFYVTVFDDQSNIVYNMTFYGLNDKNIMIDLPIGVYMVEVFSQNTYGMSGRISSTANVTMTMEASPTIEDGGEFPLYAIVVIAVGGTVLIFIIFMTIVMIALCINYKRKKDSVSFYKDDYKMTIRR